MTYPFIQARQHGDEQGTISRIVIHGTVTPCARGRARGVANDFHTTSRDASAHYVVDPGEIVQCLREDVVGYHAPPNTGSIGVELCDPQKGAGSRWADADHEAMLALAAPLVRDIASRHGIPIRRLSAADLRAGKRGICGHVDVSNAFGKTDHIDPGSAFPWTHFLDLVNGTESEDDMSTRVSLGTTKPQTVPPNTWHTVEWDKEYEDPDGQHADGGLSVLTGRARYDACAGLTLVGLPAGVTARARIVEVKPDPKNPDPVVSQGPVQQVASAGDSTDLAPFTVADLVEKGNRVRVQVKHNSIGPASLEAGASCKADFRR